MCDIFCVKLTKNADIRDQSAHTVQVQEATETGAEYSIEEGVSVKPKSRNLVLTLCISLTQSQKWPRSKLRPIQNGYNTMK
jgi:hypothetical protein